MSAAFAEAWRGPTPRERSAVVLRHRDGLPQTSVAASLGVGPPRVTRLLQSAVLKLRLALARRGVEPERAARDEVLRASLLRGVEATFGAAGAALALAFLAGSA